MQESASPARKWDALSEKCEQPSDVHVLHRGFVPFSNHTRGRCQGTPDPDDTTRGNSSGLEHGDFPAAYIVDGGTDSQFLLLYQVG
jgi:hypothetical protein